jgi:hypothetical protein
MGFGLKLCVHLVPLLQSIIVVTFAHFNFIMSIMHVGTSAAKCGCVPQRRRRRTRGLGGGAGSADGAHRRLLP